MRIKKNPIYITLGLLFSINAFSFVNEFPDANKEKEAKAIFEYSIQAYKNAHNLIEEHPEIEQILDGTNISAIIKNAATSKYVNVKSGNGVHRYSRENKRIEPCIRPRIIGFVFKSVSPNTVHLCDEWYKLPKNEKIYTMIHEIGHVGWDRVDETLTDLTSIIVTLLEYRDTDMLDLSAYLWGSFWQSSRGEKFTEQIIDIFKILNPDINILQYGNIFEFKASTMISNKTAAKFNLSKQTWSDDECDVEESLKSNPSVKDNKYTHLKVSTKNDKLFYISVSGCEESLENLFSRPVKNIKFKVTRYDTEAPVIFSFKSQEFSNISFTIRSRLAKLDRKNIESILNFIWAEYGLNK